jgi:hypothetical protein
MEFLTSDVVWSWSTLEHLVWTGISQVVSSVYLLIVGDVRSVVPVPVKWYNIVTGGLCIGLRIIELFELIISVLLTLL